MHSIKLRDLNSDVSQTKLILTLVLFFKLTFTFVNPSTQKCQREGFTAHIARRPTGIPRLLKIMTPNVDHTLL